MNREQFSGRWHEFKGKVKEKWGRLTDNEITQINGSYERLVGLLQKHYGYAKEQAEKELGNWCSSCETKHKHGMRDERNREEKGMGHREPEEMESRNWGEKSNEMKKENRGEEFWKKDETQQKPPHKDQQKKRKAG